MAVCLKRSIGRISCYVENNKNFQILKRCKSAGKLKLGIQGVPFELGQRKHGLTKGPSALRDTLFVESFRQVVKLDVKDYGDLESNSKCRWALDNHKSDPELHLPNRQTHLLRPKDTCHIFRPNEVGEAARKVARSTGSILRDGRFPLTLGGDHSISIGTVTGVAEHFGDLGVLWVDAHADINTSLTTSTGSLHGMAVSFLLKEMKQFSPQFPSFSWLQPSIEAKRFVYIGLRDVEPHEKSFLEMLGIRAYSMAEVDKLGVRTVIEMTLEYLTEGNAERPIHVSFDVDALDDVEMPCTGTPVPGGLTLREGMTLMEIVSSEVNFVSMDVVEFNPELGSVLQLIRSSKSIKELIFSSFGNHRAGVAVLDENGKPTAPLPHSTTMH